MPGPTPETRRRLKRSVQFTEHYRRDLTGPSRRPAETRTGFWAEITGGDSSGYDWIKMQLDDAGALEESTPAVTGTGTARPATPDVHAAVGTRVWLRFAGFNETDPLYLFDPIQPGVDFRVVLNKTGGSSGSASGPTTWTYTVSDLDGNTLTTAVNPTASPHIWRRPAIGPLVEATHGSACWIADGSGGYQLSVGWINETLNAEAC